MSGVFIGVLLIGGVVALCFLPYSITKNDADAQGSTVGKLGSLDLKRFDDLERGITCYTRYSNTLSCVQTPKASQ